MNSAVKVCLLSLALYLVSVIAADTAYDVTIVNNVAPCSNGQYSTISLFINSGQKVMKQGDTYVVPSSDINIYTGLGIQENGEYCRFNGSEPNCVNPDNAGMQLWINNQNCQTISLNDPFYCGKYPPNAKKFVAVAMSGTFPHCTATLTRLSSAAICQYSCPVGVNNNTGAGSTAGSTAGSSSASGSTTASSASASTTTSSKSTTTTSSSKSTTTTTTGGNKGYPKYIGCYIDQQWNRDLGLQVLSSSSTNMTIQACETACLRSGKAYAALQYGQECRCGNAYGNKGGKAAESDCKMPCSGNSSEICGAGLRNSIYQVQDVSSATNLDSGETPNTAASSSSVCCFVLLVCLLSLFML